MHTEHRILLTGGTGLVGMATVKTLFRHGWQVRFLTRNPSSERAQAVAALGASVVGGNLNDRDTLDAAMTAVDGVFSVVPLVTSYDPQEAFDTQLLGTKNVIDAAVEAFRAVVCQQRQPGGQPEPGKQIPDGAVRSGQRTAFDLLATSRVHGEFRTSTMGSAPTGLYDGALALHPAAPDRGGRHRRVCRDRL